jgi:hypothetical protein
VSFPSNKLIRKKTYEDTTAMSKHGSKWLRKRAHSCPKLFDKAEVKGKH